VRFATPTVDLPRSNKKKKLAPDKRANPKVAAAAAASSRWLVAKRDVKAKKRVEIPLQVAEVRPTR
jgi:hypothetical protein